MGYIKDFPLKGGVRVCANACFSIIFNRRCSIFRPLFLHSLFSHSKKTSIEYFKFCIHSSGWYIYNSLHSSTHMHIYSLNIHPGSYYSRNWKWFWRWLWVEWFVWDYRCYSHCTQHYNEYKQAKEIFLVWYSTKPPTSPHTYQKKKEKEKRRTLSIFFLFYLYFPNCNTNRAHVGRAYFVLCLLLWKFSY